MVYIPEEDRGAVCIFNAGRLRDGLSLLPYRQSETDPEPDRRRNRRTVYGCPRCLWRVADRTDENRMLSNIVVMGMGEPLQNVENVIKAMNIITDGEGIAVSRRRITLSTSGIAPRIVEVAEATGVRLAVSLHAPTDEIRSRIMPINKKYPLAEVMKACRDYQSRDGSRYVTFEYLMLNGINDSINANQLINLMKKYQINAKFNLIAFNPWPGCGFEPSSNNRIHAFAKVLNRTGYAAP